MQEVAEQILQTDLQVFALQEIRWKGKGQIKKDKYNLYYSCKEYQTGHLGTGFIVKKEITKNVMGFEPINKRICKIRFKPCVVGPCHHGMARPQVADRGTASFMEGSCE